MKAEVIKTVQEAEIATLRLPTHSEHCFTVPSAGNRNDRIQSAAQKQNAVILSQSVFAGNQSHSEFITKAGNVEWPAEWIQGCSQTGGNPCSMQAAAISGIIPQPVRFGGRDVGFIYEDAFARCCRLCGLLPADRTEPRGAQARSVFETAAAILAQNGFRFADTVRTWIFLDRVLDWYEDFNAVRTTFFEETGILNHRIPASTAVGAGNPFGAAITLDVFALQPKGSECTVQTVESPLQNPATDYRSSFSRAIEIGFPTHRSLLISGTASIERDGKTIHVEAPEKQIRFTMDVVHAILESRRMEWNDLFRGIAYFRDMDCLPIYRRIAAELNIPPFPLALARAEVCRHDLLFEIEVDAVKNRLA